MTVICKYCNKEYSSQSSRSNHIKKFHNNESEHLSSLSSNTSSNKIIRKSSSEYKCRFCNNTYSYIQGRWKHEKICEKSENIIKNKSIDEQKIEKIEKEMLEYKKEVEVLKNQLQKALKIHPKTLQKINNQLNNNGTI